MLLVNYRAKLKVEYKEYCDLSEILSEQMLQIFGNLLTTFILHDEQSQNFSTHRPYYESERGSPIIPCWVYFLKGWNKKQFKSTLYLYVMIKIISFFSQGCKETWYLTFNLKI